MNSPVTIDNATGDIIVEPEVYINGVRMPGFGPRAAQYGFSGAGPKNGGFGITRKMLDTQPILTAPWLTPELAEKEIGIGGFK